MQYGGSTGVCPLHGGELGCFSATYAMLHLQAKVLPRGESQSQRSKDLLWRSSMQQPYHTTSKPTAVRGLAASGCGRLIFIHLQCWEVLPFCRFQRQRCIKILCPKDPDFYTPLALKTAKRQHLPALEVYKNQSPRMMADSQVLWSASWGQCTQVHMWLWRELFFNITAE